MKYSIILIIFLLISTLSYAQENNIQLTLVNNDTLFQTSIDELVEDSVKISILGQSRWIKINSIIEIRQIKNSKFWKGAGIGLLSGAFLGGMIGRAAYKKEESDPSNDSFDIDFGPEFSTFAGALLGGLSGILVGAITGASYGKDEVYDLSQTKLEQKIKIIESIIAKKNKVSGNKK